MQPIKSMSQKRGGGGLRGFERRETGQTAYYKLAIWDTRNMTWKDGKTAYASEAEAIIAATKPGRYRVSKVGQGGRADLETFEVLG